MSPDTSLTPAQREDLLALAGIIIPASDEFDVPGADDPAIQADMLATLGRDAAPVREALDELARIAGAPLAALDPGRREQAALELRSRGGVAVAALTRVVLQCYYRDDRVVRSLGLEPRPPYPKGHVLEDGDWSLLDPVRMRAPLLAASVGVGRSCANNACKIGSKIAFAANCGKMADVDQELSDAASWHANC